MSKGFCKILLPCIGALIVGGCTESEFHLANESRLPVWFEVPEGIPRERLDVVLTYHTIGPAKLSLRDSWNEKQLEAIYPKNEWHPEYWEWAQKDWPKRAHPGYVILSKENRSEIVEHRKMEPVFYVSDEATVQATIRGENAPNK